MQIRTNQFRLTLSLRMRKRAQKQKAHSKEWAFYDYAGDHLISHTISRAVPSAQRGLTSVFGMGTGVTLAVWSPANLGALGRLFLLQPGNINELFLSDTETANWRHIQPNISQRNRSGIFPLNLLTLSNALAVASSLKV